MTSFSKLKAEIFYSKFVFCDETWTLQNSDVTENKLINKRIMKKREETNISILIEYFNMLVFFTKSKKKGKEKLSIKKIWKCKKRKKRKRKRKKKENKKERKLCIIKLRINFNIKK